MLCYRCGSHVQDGTETCPTCGQKLAAAGGRQATGTFSRRKPSSSAIEGAPYKPTDLVASRYLIKDTVGAGPLGFVFRAHDKEVDVEVALKVINPKLVQMADERKQFAKVLRLARKLNHPNIVRVYEEGEDNERPYFTSQFLDGLTLRKIIDLRLQKGQFFTVQEIEPIISQIGAALEGAHKVGPHSDVRPENVLVLPDLLKITDFGLGLAVPRLPFVQAMKARKADRYFSPEMTEGSDIDGRADIYSMGVIVGEMLSGLTPDGSIPELARCNPAVSQAIEGFYRKAVNANPNARQKSAAEFVSEFSDLVKKSAPPPMPTRPEPAAGPQPIARPRTNTGMLQLQPRREKPPPPLNDQLPPPPPPMTGENPVPPARVAKPVAPEAPENREETQVLDSGMFIAQVDQEAETRAVAPVVSVSGPPQSSRSWVIAIVVLVIVGAALGALGGLYVTTTRKAAEAQKAAEDQARRDAEARAAAEVAKLNQAQTNPVDPAKVAAEKAEAEKRAAEAAAVEKAAADKAAADKAEADRLAAEAAAKAASDKQAPVPSEKEMAEKAAALKAAAEQAARAEKLAADKAAADKAAAEKASADKIAADKAAADKTATEKGVTEKLAADKAFEKPVATTPKNGLEFTCPEGMAMIRAGAFKMGTPADDPMKSFDERGLTRIEVPATCVDIFEYPNKRGATPQVAVSFADAQKACQSAGKRLCSEQEWEKACKGPANDKWPYGSAFNYDACNTEDEAGDSRALAAAGKFAKCRSPYGVFDMAGNVSEWTADRTIKGGSYASADYAVRCSARKNGGSVSKSSEVGFRCCADPQ